MKQNKTAKGFKNIKWALVLSGGGARGYAHLGVINALYKLGVPRPSMVVGTSMGAIVGGLFACGKTPEELIRFALEEFDISEHLDSFVYKIDGPLGRVFQTGQILTRLASSSGVDSGDGILKLLEELTGGIDFEETSIPFRCNAIDLVNGEEVVLWSGSLARAIRASMSFPVFFTPVIDGDYCLMDGGLANNMPVHIPRSEGIKAVLAVDAGGFRVLPLSEYSQGSRLIARVFEVAMHAMQNDDGQRANITLNILDRVTPLDFSQASSIIELGEQAVIENIDAIKTFFGRGPKSIISRKSFRSFVTRPKE